MSKILPRFVSASRNFMPQFAIVTLLAACGVAPAQTVPTAGTSSPSLPTLLPYTVKLIAGGGTAAIASGATCPVSGFTSTDAYGDGCLATEIQLSAPRYAVADSAGNIFFSDYTNGLVRRVDASTGVVTTIAGGATASPASGATCGSYTSIDAHGDGCLATAVKLSKPAGLAFGYYGNLYFGEVGNSDVRMVAAASNGLIPATGGGVISNVAGNGNGTYGYAASNSTATIVAATQSYLDSPYDVVFDGSGNLYIAEEYKEAILVVNTNASTTTTVMGINIPPGTIAKILGEYSGSSTCPNSPASTNGCSYGTSTFGIAANSTAIDGPYGVAVDTAANVFVADEYYNFVGKIAANTDIFTQYAGIQNSPAKVLTRGVPGTFGIGSTFGVAADTAGNVYITDASSGVIWRVDVGGTTQYVIAGGGTACSKVVDAYGDGCPATQATFGSSGSGNFATTANPGIFGISADSYSNLYVGDTITNVIREVSSGTQFGNVGETSTATQIVDIHFVAGDAPNGTTPYLILTGAKNFSIGTPSCTVNKPDLTTDCLLPITAAPSALGAFGGTLQVSSLNGIVLFPLTATGVMTPVTRTSILLTNSGNCTGTSTFSTATALTFTATIASSGSPTGTITFYANGAQIGTPQTVTNNAATLTYTFATAGTYIVTAGYSGDSYYNKSTSLGGAAVSTAAPSFTASALPYSYSTVVAGETALYSFLVSQTVYTGSITMACSNLPAHSSCSFSPTVVTGLGCSTTNTIALSILTSQGPITTSSFGGTGHGPWSLVSMIAGFGLALAIGLNRRRTQYRFAQLGMVVALLLATTGMMACSDPITTGSTARTPASPAGQPYSVTVTATGSTGTTSSFTVPLTVQ